MFCITLPLQRQAASEPQATPIPTPTSTLHQARPSLASARTPDPTAPVRALVVEDIPINRDILVDMLARLGVPSDTASNGVEALKRLLAGPRDYGLVLMDIQMPELDGYETTLRLRSEPTISRLPVVAITAHALAKDREHCLAVDMDDYLPKPLDPQHLAAVIRHWLPAAHAPKHQEPNALGAPRPQSGTTETVAATTQDAQHWLNFDHGLAFCANDLVLYRNLLGTFADGHRATAHLLAGPLFDPTEIRRIAHNLKGTAPMIGAEALGAIAASLDDPLRPQGGATDAPDPSQVRTMAKALREALVQTLEAIDTLLRQTEHQESDDTPARTADD